MKKYLLAGLVVLSLVSIDVLPDTLNLVSEAEAASVCFGGLCVNGGSVRRPRSSGGNRPSTPSQARWSTTVIEAKQIATNNHGLIVTYDDSGALILNAMIKNPVPNVKANMAIPVIVDLGRRGNFSVTGAVNTSLTSVVISGATAHAIARGLKSGSRADVTFLGNNYKVQLRGSQKAIEQVELAAQQWQLLRKDQIDDARKDNAKAEMKTRTQQRVDGLQVADEQNRGVRPKENLRDGPRKVSDLRVQYYIPGTREIGDMWVNWDVDEKGLYIGLNFIDPDHKYDNRAHTIRMPFEKDRPACEQDLKKKPEILMTDCRFTRALLKGQVWKAALEKKKYRKSVTKVIDYIRGSKEEQNALAVIFKRYEDGGYALQIEDRKFGVSKLFNFTVANALDLARITQDAVEEANQGTATEEDIDAILQ